MFKQAIVIGDGQMGLVMAEAACSRGMKCRLWGPFGDDLAKLAERRESPRLPGFRIPEGLKIESDALEGLRGADLVVSSVPTQHLRAVWSKLGQQVEAGATIVSVTKGIENQTLMRPSEIIAEAIGTDAMERICVLSGPTIAAELARHQPATMVAASAEGKVSQAVQEALGVSWLRIYTVEDVIGVEIAAAAKNVIALAAGMLDGLNIGYNAKSALLTRGLAEITRLGVALGAKAETFFGIAGVGDLATTCFSPEGRNRMCGERLGRGQTLEEVLGATTSVVEGVATSRSIRQLAERVGVDMPISEAVHCILFEGLSPANAMRQLMQREQKPERVR